MITNKHVILKINSLRTPHYLLNRNNLKKSYA